MNTIRSILILLYFLVMVLLPHGHHFLDSHGMHAVHAAPACGHEHGQESPSDEDGPSSSGHGSCTLCKLLTVAADAPQTDLTLHTALHLERSFAEPDSRHVSFLRPACNARAPPLMTV